MYKEYLLSSYEKPKLLIHSPLFRKFSLIKFLIYVLTQETPFSLLFVRRGISLYCVCIQFHFL